MSEKFEIAGQYINEMLSKMQREGKLIPGYPTPSLYDQMVAILDRCMQREREVKG